MNLHQISITNMKKTNKMRQNEIESDGPAVVRVNIFVRSISKIDDVTMVSVREFETSHIFESKPSLFKNKTAKLKLIAKNQAADPKPEKNKNKKTYK